MIRRFLRSLLSAAFLAAFASQPGFAQADAQTLAEMRSELAALAESLQQLRAELVTGGPAALQAAGGSSALDRMNAMEAELVRLTSRSEALQNRIDRIVADAGNRIGDLEFRICELEPGCDPANMPITASLGGAAPAGGTAPAAPGAPPSAGSGTPELAIAEQSDFDRAKAALDSGDFRGAADKFAAFAQTYPGSPLTGDAQFLRGEALGQLGDTSNAARAYLDAFSGAPDGPRAAASLLRLGAALGTLGQNQEACVTLAEVGARFPATPEAGQATEAMRALGCQ